MANQMDKYMEDKFLHEVDSKDGFPVRECRDARERRILEFLVPIVHSAKPTRVTHTLDNTIFGALNGDRPVDWAKIFMDLINRLVGGVGKSKPTPICPFLYHLYESKGLLMEEEETDYRVAKELTWYRITPDHDPDSESEGVRVIIAPAPQQPSVAPVNQVKRGNRLKQTYRALEGSPSVSSKEEGSQPHSRSPEPEKSQLDPQPEPQRSEQPEGEEEERP